MDLFSQEQHKWLVRIIFISAIAHILILIFAVSHNLNTLSRIIIYGGYLQLLQLYLASALGGKDAIARSNTLKVVVGVVGIPCALLSLVFVTITDRNGPEDKQGSSLVTIALALAAVSWISLFAAIRMMKNDMQKIEPTNEIEQQNPTATNPSQQTPHVPAPQPAAAPPTTIVIQQQPAGQTAPPAPASAAPSSGGRPGGEAASAAGSWLDMLLGFT
jgi:hypothetical protein